jgi:accessory gene regulator protein AgrB
LLSNIVLLALMAEIALILPITYKIFKMPYNNYKTYVHKLN